MKILRFAFLLLLSGAAGCVSEAPKPLPKFEPGEEERSYYKPLTGHKLELRHVGSNAFETGKKASVIYRLRNIGKKAVKIEDWRIRDDDNILVFCQPWLPGMKDPDPQAWVSLNEGVAEHSRRNPLILQQSNMVTLNRALPFVEHMYVSPGKERRFFVKAVLNLKSVSLESPVTAVRIHAPLPPQKK
ncbi:MAG: hypothetical protein J6C40_12800 [Lentisphaeria bacterium]|nr:hypothetical protein [Lentisphaeria bacterium]